MLSKKRVASVVVLIALSSPGCAPPEPPKERIGNTNDLIVGGTPDDSATPMFPEVVFLQIGPLVNKPGNNLCTGTLITPLTVLTARHCFEDAVNGFDSDVTVEFGFDAPTNPPDKFHTFSHTSTNSGPVLTLSSSLPVDIHDDSDVARDVAVFFLDAPVPNAIAAPRHPSLDLDVCPASFDGTVVGFGAAFDSGSDPGDICNNSKVRERRFRTTGGWERDIFLNPPVSLYFNSWPIVIGAIFDPCLYKGTAPGDSGGPLLDDQSPPHICGVVSSTTSHQGFISVFLDDHQAGIDSDATINLFQNGKAQTPFGPISAIDPHGEWLGECADSKRACINWEDCSFADADNDRVIDRCDSCPTIFNPEPLSYNDDVDGNGWGAACDFCPGVNYSFGGRNLSTAGNGNYEIELAEAYPGQTEPFANTGGILLGPKTAAFNTAQAAYLAAFHPNECDPTDAKAPANDLSG